MANNYDDNVDIDVDNEADTDAEMIDAPNGNGRDDFAARPSLREVWESNPIMKIAAVVLGGVVLVGGYMTIFGGGDVEDNKAIVMGSDLKNVSAVPGTENADPEYVRALQEQNKADAEQALQTGGSSVPVPIGTASNSALTVPTAPDAAQSDPLTAWRKEAETRRLAMEQQVMADEEPEETAPAPEVVPMVQPVRPQAQAARVDPEAPKRLAAQMRVIMAAQAPANSRVAPITVVPSGYVQMKQAEAEAKAQQAQQLATMQASGMSTTDMNGRPIGQVDKVIVSAGSIVYGQLMNQLNSDLPGPVLVSLLSGPFAGGRAIGQLEVKSDYMILTFTKVIKDGVVYQVQGVALDEETTLTGHRTDIDRHYFTRVILPAAAEFIKGYAGAAAETATSTTTTSGGGVVQDNPSPDAREQVFAGVEEGADQLSDILEDEADRPVTIHLDKGTTLGILFIDSVTTASAQ